MIYESVSIIIDGLWQLAAIEFQWPILTSTAQILANRGAFFYLFFNPTTHRDYNSLLLLTNMTADMDPMVYFNDEF
jgi:hypothetical protein